MNRRRGRAAIGAALALWIAGLTPSSTASVAELPVPTEPGFVVTPYSATGGTPSSLAFGPDTRDGEKGERLYVADNTQGRILVIDDLGGAGSPPATFAEGFDGPLGVIAAKNGDVYVADAEPAREGPFGFRAYGRVWRVIDTDGDGVADKKHVVLKDLPNGRHNTNGLDFGPDGMLYVTNGNSTDDGIEGGETEVQPWSGSVVKVDPKAKNVSISDLKRRKALVATGWRNVYDLAFSPVDKSLMFVPMNGIDDARKGSTGDNPIDPALEDSDDLLFATDVNDKRVDDFGFPSCLYNVAEKGNLKPYNSPNPDVIKRFGKCPKNVPRPVSSFGLHTSSDGLAFQSTDAWGGDYSNDLFVTEWGSLFGPPRGHDVIRVQLDKSGRKVVSQSVFMAIDTPLDVAFDSNGVMYVADFSGQIFRVDKPV
jgi:glucose/arabinose dehydrogenase